MMSDRCGLAVTASTAESVARRDATITAYCGFKLDTGDRLRATLAGDPHIVFGQILHGYFMLLLVKRELAARARKAARATPASRASCGRIRRARQQQQRQAPAAPTGRFQPIQSHSARPMTRFLSAADRNGSSSVNNVTHWRHEHGMRVMSVPQNIRRGPKAS